MLQHASKIVGCEIVSPEGPVGKIHDIFFDEAGWVLRYIVADVGRWPGGERVLLPFAAVGMIDEGQRQAAVTLAKHDVENSPKVSTCITADEEAEALLGKFWMWTVPSVGRLPREAALVIDSEATSGEKEEVESEVQSRLRSVAETLGYHIAAPDGDIGHLRDFLVDSETWQIRHLAVNAGNWLLQRNVRIPCAALESIHWADRRVHLSITRDEIRNSPEYDPGQAVEQSGTE